jgi:hypothetical protein
LGSIWEKSDLDIFKKDCKLFIRRYFARILRRRLVTGLTISSSRDVNIGGRITVQPERT